MKAKKINRETQPHAAKFSFQCGDFQKMAEMMKSCCLGEGDVMDCCSMMRKMMGRSKETEAKETKET